MNVDNATIKSDMSKITCGSSHRGEIALGFRGLDYKRWNEDVRPVKVSFVKSAA